MTERRIGHADRRPTERARKRLDLVIVAALLILLIVGRDIVVESNATNDARDQCVRSGARAEVLYDFIGDAQEAWRGVRENAVPKRQEVKRVLLSLGIPQNQLVPTLALFISPDEATNATHVIEAYAKLRGRLRLAVADDEILAGHVVRVDCAKEFSHSFPGSLFFD